MEFEDILSGLGVVIIAVISIISRFLGKKNAQTKPHIETTEPTTRRAMRVEHMQHPDSSEQIVDEIAISRSTHKLTNSIKTRKDRNEGRAKNATNRTFNKVDKIVDTTPESQARSKRFNAREAVIYSEILTPKFKESKE